MGTEIHISCPGCLRVCAAATVVEPGVIETVTEKTKGDLAKPWNVVVQNDPINLTIYVTMVFQKVFGYPRQKAELLMMEVHTRGRAVVWTGGREPAEHYVRVLQQYHLWAILEQAEP
ncbi:MAG: ATP-dependent Clp protease adapter ClpS [Verrucomicrobiae bacterium]|nr:ATP-dependent Clp protease adapter ClpS [Verrucomicrobiae bacterium]